MFSGGTDSAGIRMRRVDGDLESQSPGSDGDYFDEREDPFCRVCGCILFLVLVGLVVRIATLDQDGDSAPQSATNETTPFFNIDFDHAKDIVTHTLGLGQ